MDETERRETLARIAERYCKVYGCRPSATWMRSLSEAVLPIIDEMRAESEGEDRATEDMLRDGLEDFPQS